METSTVKFYSIEAFLEDYLKVLNLTFKKFAVSIDTTDSNLKKYLSGQRKFNIDLAMKFGYFFHTSPELWLRVYTKNEFYLLTKEKSKASKYKKYDYLKVVELERA
jgi:plasmid maintenance system antidote protein VapI